MYMSKRNKYCFPYKFQKLIYPYSPTEGIGISWGWVRVLFQGKFIQYDKADDENIEVGSKYFQTHERGALRKLLGQEGGAENLYTSKPTGGGTPKKLNRQQGGLLKFQASSFNIFIPPPSIVILNELFLRPENLKKVHEA